MKRNLRRVRTNVIARDAGAYLSFPDVVQTGPGKLLCAFREADRHYPPDASRTHLILIQSPDNGLSWENRRIFPQLLKDHSKWAWHCPRLTRLLDGRIVLLCDLCNPEIGDVGIYCFISADGGSTWSEGINTGAFGIMPDRALQLSASEWIFGAHYELPEEKRLYEFVWATEDGGRTWKKRGEPGNVLGLNLCEGSIIRAGNTLLCYMRENSFIHAPIYFAASEDAGKTWGRVMPHPTHGHRPCAGLLGDGSLLLTYRNVAGNPGLFGWTGDPLENGYFAGGLDLSGHDCSLNHKILEISSDGSPERAAQFFLRPCEDAGAMISLSARIRAEAPDEFSTGLRAVGLLRLLPGYLILELPFTRERVQLCRLFLDTTVFHTYLLTYASGSLTLAVDGTETGTWTTGTNLPDMARRIAFGNVPAEDSSRVSFSRHGGRSFWESVEYSLTSAAGNEYRWSWNAAEGGFPNQYLRDRAFQIDREESGILWDSGYSGWIELERNTFYCVDYRRGLEKKPYIVGHTLAID